MDEKENTVEITLDMYVPGVDLYRFVLTLPEDKFQVAWSLYRSLRVSPNGHPHPEIDRRFDSDGLTSDKPEDRLFRLLDKADVKRRWSGRSGTKFSGTVRGAADRYCGYLKIGYMAWRRLLEN